MMDEEWYKNRFDVEPSVYTYMRENKGMVISGIELLQRTNTIQLRFLVIILVAGMMAIGTVFPE